MLLRPSTKLEVPSPEAYADLLRRVEALEGKGQAIDQLRREPHDPVETLLKESVTEPLLADAAVTDSKLADAAVTDSKLESPNNATWKTIFHAYGLLGLGGGVATYLMGANQMLASGVAGTQSAPIFYLESGDYSVGGKSSKLRVKAQIACNTIAPTRTYTFGLYPISSVAGGANQLTYTLGTVTPGSTVAFSSPSASTLAQGNSGDFTIPSNNYYCLGMAQTGGAIAANAMFSLHAYLQYRAV